MRHSHLGLIARLLAPAIGAIALGHTPIALSLDDLWWQDDLGGPYPRSVTPGQATRVPAVGAALEAVTVAIADRYRVSGHVLWGNVGSATSSATRLIAAARPDLSGTAHAVADSYLTDPRIEDCAAKAGPDATTGRPDFAQLFLVELTGLVAAAPCRARRPKLVRGVPDVEEQLSAAPVQ